MKGRSISKLFTGGLAVIAFFLQIQLQISCAVIVPPGGGPRDTLPPRLLSANPADSSLNFNGNRIVLTFDEFVDLQDVSKNLLFMPATEHTPTVNNKLRTITIRLRDPLERNTTYTLNLGDAIRDVNESNIIHNFSYTFSTGPVMDTSIYTGKVVLAETGLVDTTLQAVLYRDFTDSAVYKKNPLYVSKVDKEGNFMFRNLPRDSFAIYVLEPAGGLRRYQDKSKLFAFANQPVIVGRTPSLKLLAYREQLKKIIQPSAASGSIKAIPNEKARLRFNTISNGAQQDLLDDLTLTFLVPLRTIDTTKMQLTTDSAFHPTTYSTDLDTSKSILKIHTNWKPNTLYNLILQKDFATDTMGRQLLKADTLRFMTKKETDYGSVRLRVRNLDTAVNPVLQFVQNDKVMYSAPIKSGIFSSRLFLPGDYDLRILYDQNNNGKWDPGHFFGVKRQPETVLPLGKKISIKPDWDNEFEASL
jgi:hypothetical protein